MFSKAVYKYHSYCGTVTDKSKVVPDFMEDVKNCTPVSVTHNKTSLFVTFTDNKYLCAYRLPLEYLRFIPSEIEKARQWVADDYHCSEIWGQKQTEEEMLLELTEMQKCKSPEDYSPHPVLFRECAAYWNALCDAYPN